MTMIDLICRLDANDGDLEAIRDALCDGEALDRLDVHDQELVEETYRLVQEWIESGYTRLGNVPH